MNITVISDTHLTHLGHDTRKFNYLFAVCKEADRVIINGDFWDGYISTFSQFLVSSWNKLFALLKKKKAIYLFGNHDKRTWCDTRVKQFCQHAQQEVKLDFGKYQLHIEHGDRISPKIDAAFPFVQRRPIFGRLAEGYEQLGLALLGNRFLLLGNSRYNVAMKEYVRKQLSKQTILLCGHSHLPELSMSERFANSGFIRNGYASYLRIENGTISLVRERYE